MGLILLNVCLAALFYDPVEKHLKKRLVPRDDSMEGPAEIPEEPAKVGRGPASKLVDIGSNVSGLLLIVKSDVIFILIYNHLSPPNDSQLN